jgi:hypothetical protein
VWSTEGARLESRPLRIEPEGIEVSEDRTEPSTQVGSNVLDEHVSRLHGFDGVPHPGPHVLSDVPSSSSLGEGGTGVAAEDEIDILYPAPVDLGDVTKVGHTRPVLGQHCRCVRVDLGLPPDVNPGTLKAEIHPTNAREERSGFEQGVPRSGLAFTA